MGYSFLYAFENAMYIYTYYTNTLYATYIYMQYMEYCMHSTVSIPWPLFSFNKVVRLFIMFDEQFMFTIYHRCVSRFSTHFGTLCLKHISALGWNTDEVWMCLPKGSTSSWMKLLFGSRACATVRGHGSTWSRSSLALTSR